MLFRSNERQLLDLLLGVELRFIADEEVHAVAARENVDDFLMEVEIWRHLEPYRTGEKPITGDTVITKDLTIDSLAVMDMVMELEDRFDISIPMNVVAEIYTVDELADTILDLSARR